MDKMVERRKCVPEDCNLADLPERLDQLEEKYQEAHNAMIAVEKGQEITEKGMVSLLEHSHENFNHIKDTVKEVRVDFRRALDKFDYNIEKLTDKVSERTNSIYKTIDEKTGELHQKVTDETKGVMRWKAYLWTLFGIVTSVGTIITIVVLIRGG